MSTPTEDLTAVAEEPLTLHDRCDRCGSQAYVRVRFRNGHDLLYCGHDYAKHSLRLLTYEGVTVRDERYRLIQRTDGAPI
jgi:ribosomal protein L37E